jgi:hypothetical protein
VSALSVVYYACFLYVFRLAWTDFSFAALMGLVSRLYDFFVWLILAALIMSIAANRAGPVANPFVPAIRAPIAIAPSTPMVVQPGQNTATVMDELISQQIKRNEMIEGYTWCRTGAADDAIKKLVSDMYHAGAVKVYMDGFTLVAQLPDDPAKRSDSLKVAQTFRQDHGMPDHSASSLSYRYVVINLLGERLGSMKNRH